MFNEKTSLAVFFPGLCKSPAPPMVWSACAISSQRDLPYTGFSGDHHPPMPFLAVSIFEPLASDFGEQIVCSGPALCSCVFTPALSG